MCGNDKPRVSCLLAQRIALGFTALVASAQLLADPPNYIVTPVTASWGTIFHGAALNNAGDVAGTATVSGGSSAFLWSYSTKATVRLGTLGGNMSSASGLNDCDAAVGQSSLSGEALKHAVLFQNGRRTDIDPRGTISTAYDINNAGTIVGSATIKDVLRPVAFSHGLIKPLSPMPGEALAVSLSGQIAGYVLVDTPVPQTAHGFIIEGGTFTDFNESVSVGTSASGINDYGDLAGTEVILSFGYLLPFLYQDSSFQPTPSFPNGYKYSAASAINNAGHIVGYSDVLTEDPPFPNHATLTRGQVIYDLNDLIDVNDPLKPYVTVFHAYGINDSDWIVADGADSRDTTAHVYLLVLKNPGVSVKRLTGGCPR